MASNSLPANLQKVLENHVAQSDLADDDELRGIIARLAKLNESVERVKASIMTKRAQKQAEG
ncbi:hypothetical protein KIH87_07150 [Paraneptunicella aestuarii]|uniref:hypothetical protein n=1 Tax=Paraneptunicella aestuarii TaxID=2831148 RepID=UPI001E471875|nr:hypothetical protein [Paraneptunicella aestuarii]UAA40116.1 hypothetical protein KIH87_07150 [Paraneptunicella aestuarii]